MRPAADARLQLGELGRLTRASSLTMSEEKVGNPDPPDEFTAGKLLAVLICQFKLWRAEQHGGLHRRRRGVIRCDRAFLFNWVRRRWNGWLDLWSTARGGRPTARTAAQKDESADGEGVPCFFHDLAAAKRTVNGQQHSALYFRNSKR